MICLGNLSVSDIEKRLNIKFSEEDKKWLEERHNPNANYIKENGWHCYDIPFSFCCGSNEFAQECIKVLMPYSHLMKGQMSLSVFKKEEEEG